MVKQFIEWLDKEIEENRPLGLSRHGYIPGVYSEALRIKAHFEIMAAEYREEMDKNMELTRENIEVLISIAYRSGWDDGKNGKDLPTLKELDDMARGIYDRATEAGNAAGS